MKGSSLSVCAFVLMLSTCALSVGDSQAGAASDLGLVYEPHGRIVIMGDEDFTAENGVRSGNGTTLNPYVIEGWEIDLSESSESDQYNDGIVVQNTDAWFVIRDVRIHSGEGAEDADGAHGSAIMMYHVRLASVVDCIMSNNSGGVHLQSCSMVSIVGCLVADNHGGGISTSGCELVSVRDCVIARNYWGGVEFGSAQYCDVADSTVTGSEHWVAVNLYGSEHCSVRNCNVTYNTGVGINIGFSEDCNVSGNLIEGNGIGTCMYYTEKITMESNVYLDNDEDLRDDTDSEMDLRPAIVSIVIVVAVIAITLFLDRRHRLKERPK